MVETDEMLNGRSIATHKMGHSSVETVQGQLKHREDISDYPYGPRHGPQSKRSGVEPRAMAERLGQHVQAIDTR